MKTLVFNSYEDPGHGWLKVPRKLLEEINLINDISSYSYQLGESVYLEEDSDLSKFFKRMEESNRPFTIKTHHTNNQSRIRTYASFTIAKPITLANGLEFLLYGNKYKTIDANRRIVKQLDNSQIYKLRKTQLDELKPLDIYTSITDES